MDKRISKSQSLVRELLLLAGIKINGSEEYDIQIHNDNFYTRVLRNGDLGLGESYVERWWDSKRIDLMIERLVNARVEEKLKKSPYLLFKLLLSKIFNFQNPRRAFQVGEKHYDIGNDLFKIMLDSRMNYSCGYWKSAATLDEAQLNKLDLVCRKLLLKPGMRLLDIGCGWGGLARFAAENYGVQVLGITVSKQQYELAKTYCANLPVEIRLQDYRKLEGTFDRIASLGMFEHVGHLNYRKYMQIASNCLIDEGIFLLHCIGGNASTTQASPWISKYIFPNGMLPSIAQIGTAVEHLLVMEDWHNFGPDYYKTLMAWYDNFLAGWDKIKNNYDESFFRMWNYYLLSCAGTFKARDLQLWQIVFSKNGLKERYEAPR
ncbi:cyclopropane fatty acyl phospholipid synthase [Legionella fallonii]|uniref:Cyclopropane fatty acyl phospholipid synthase (Unsaturated-phospholipid methyltransferase) n=1 Tax=Legionella fallonii LLAP-10 TaxID=1212491 RepID=A0A098G5L0_9GAMM|nr:cyclopropane fatty acyl phospholipid synthase [Legionella fallonii]CEG57742.1 cyclopropane fatty acyl phospholipid synthase (unsaturated-phospholipid methyltransferase) [Legionella fallonii LLAP-10]